MKYDKNSNTETVKDYLDELKTRYEIDDTTLYDSQLESYINSSLALLSRNGLDDEALKDPMVIDYLYIDILPKFDKTLLNNNNLVDMKMSLIQDLRTIYDI